MCCDFSDLSGNRISGKYSNGSESTVCNIYKMLISLSGGVHVVGYHSTEFSQYLLIILLCILIVSLFRIGFAWFPQKLKIVPETGVIILLGCAFGGLLIAAGFQEHEILSFNPEIFFVCKFQILTKV